MSDISKVWRPSDAPQDANTLYRSHGHWLLAFLRRRFSAQEAEDLVQDAFVQMVASKAAIRHPRAFLVRLALDAAGMKARRQKARPFLVSDDLAYGALAEPADQEQALLLKQAILALPQRLQEVFLLSRFAGLTYQEISQRCGVSVKTVEARMSQALAMCTALLDERAAPDD